MKLARWAKERIGTGTHTPFRSDTVLGVVANFAAFLSLPLLIVVMPVLWLFDKFRRRRATRR